MNPSATSVPAHLIIRSDGRFGNRLQSRAAATTAQLHAAFKPPCVRLVASKRG
jgi:hypothetical protein